MPRLTESKGTAVTVFVQIPHKREQRLFVWCCICLRVFREKQSIWQKSGISFVPIIWGRFFGVIGNSLKFPMTQKRSDECLQPTKMWKNKILILGGERSMKGNKKLMEYCGDG